VVGEAGNGDEALRACRALQPQLVLLDIRMPGRDGMAVARELAGWEQAPAVVFCTAYDEYAVDAFEANAIGYLLKPVNRDKLAQALQKARRLSAAELESVAEPRPAAARRLHISARSRRGVELLPVEEARYFIADHKYVTVIHPGGELLIDDTLKELEQEFAPELLRVHRNALVALAHVQGLERVEAGQYRVRLAGVDQGPVVSRRHLPTVKKVLTGI
ncbi:MAG: LytTR family DNA-binding domain-containing protein, partial [Spongiibacteraceae bacterium]|nr:LytTR family DNA-binding domain-containing protein [Spongiibacteraceae bacterium]